jgi:4'-phosphopantetheinyl transferase
VSSAQTTGGKTLDPRRPQIWVFDTTDAKFDGLADQGLASEQERERASTLSVPAAARKLLARRTAVRLVLARHCLCDPVDLRLVTAPGGKPVLLPSSADHRTVSFSTGHSGDLYCIAIATSASVGIDVELLRSVTRAHSIARRWFGEAEARRLEAHSADVLDEEFMRMWTAKEALAKRHGAGLRLMRGREGELDIDAAEENHFLRFFEPGPGYSAAIASTEVIDDIDVTRAGGDVWIT